MFYVLLKYVECLQIINTNVNMSVYTEPDRRFNHYIFVCITDLYYIYNDTFISYLYLIIYIYKMFYGYFDVFYINV